MRRSSSKIRNFIFLCCIIFTSCNFSNKIEINAYRKIDGISSSSSIDYFVNDNYGKIDRVFRWILRFTGAKPNPADPKDGDTNFNSQQDNDLNGPIKRYELKNLYFFIGTFFILTTIFGLYQLWKNRKTSQKNYAYLTLLNKQITDQNLNLQKTLNALEQSQDENKRVMKIVAHDLRSPIGAIGSLAALMLDEKNLEKQDEHLLNLIKNAASDSLCFVNELLNTNYLVVKLEKESVDLNALLNYCVNLLQYKATEKQQTIVLKSVPLIFNFNREKVWRVISNLITNAIKFSPKNTTIEIEMRIESKNVFISVKDAGIGIPENMKSKIFNISKEAMRPGTDGEKTYGMGLVISKQIVEAHGGKLWFESIETKGSTFFAQLPIE